MPLILESFEEERSMDSGIFSAQVVSAFPMSELDLVSIKPLLKEKFGSDLKFSFDIDPTLLGGFVVSVKDKVLDFSLKGRLSGLRHTLLA
jgi:F-type H+-transporting ATPase subunit delta